MSSAGDRPMMRSSGNNLHQKGFKEQEGEEDGPGVGIRDLPNCFYRLKKPL